MIAAMTSVARRTRHREQRENTRREILSAADGFLRERPYRELSVEIVMAQTGLTRTAFYRHFDDLPDVVLRLLADVGSELFAIAERWIEGSPVDFRVAAGEALRGIVGFFERQGPLVCAIAEAAVTDERIEQGYSGFLETFIEMTARALDDLIALGQIEPLDAMPVARALNLMNERYLLSEFGREPLGDREVAIATLETVWLRTVASR